MRGLPNKIIYIYSDARAYLSMGSLGNWEESCWGILNM